jgi:hypothetical protein
MKKELITLSLLALVSLSEAQTWGGSGSQTGDAYRTGKVGIGTTSPARELEVSSATGGDGIKVTQTGSGAAGFHLNASSGHLWSLYSTGDSDGWATDNDFAIYDETAGGYPRLYIEGNNGNVGIGTIYPGSKFHVLTDDGAMSNNPINQNYVYYEPTDRAAFFRYEGSTNQGVNTAAEGSMLSNAASTGGNIVEGIGVFGRAERTASSSGNTGCVGVYGRALGASYNIGGVFKGDGAATIGKSASSNNSKTCFGIWASAGGRGGSAGYFNGTTYSSDFYQSADDKLKSNIEPIKNSIEKLKLLKPNSFTFNTNENGSMNLPSGLQMGLSANDLEVVFPELVKEIKDMSLRMETEKENDVKSYKTINYLNLIPLLIAGVQEQQKQIDNQKQMINELQTKLSVSTGVDQINFDFENVKLEQNTPNPFNQETVIKYTLTAQINNAYIAVYDLSGKQITKFALDQKGSSSITITNDKLASGIYIYSIIADGKVLDSKRMIVADK